MQITPGQGDLILIAILVFLAIAVPLSLYFAFDIYDWIKREQGIKKIK